MPEIAEVAKFTESIKKISLNSIESGTQYCFLNKINLLGGRYMSWHIKNARDEWINKIKNPKTGRMVNIKSDQFPDGEYRQCLPGLDQLNSELPLKIINIDSKGKYCWIELENDWFIGFTFGMSGTIQYSLEKHSHLEFQLIGSEIISNNTKSFYFGDPRHMGTITISKDRQILTDKLNSLGIDLLHGTDVPLQNIVKVFRSIHYNSRNIMTVLMDQKGPLAGIGNYLKAEILYQCGINPWAIVSDLSDIDIERLIDVAKSTMSNAFDKHGATLYTYVPTEKTSGEFQHELKVYGKLNDPLGNQVITINESTSPDKRTTHYCPTIQIIGQHRDTLFSEKAKKIKIKINLK